MGLRRCSLANEVAPGGRSYGASEKRDSRDSRFSFFTQPCRWKAQVENTLSNSRPKMTNTNTNMRLVIYVKAEVKS